MELQDDEELPFWFEASPGASERDIAAAEAYVGRSLPLAFRELLLGSNGGVSNYSGFESRGEFFPLLPILSVGENAAIGTIQSAFDVRNEFGVADGLVVFAAHGNAWWAFDFRHEERLPSVVYCDDPGEPVVEVAENFEGLMAGLVE